MPGPKTNEREGTRAVLHYAGVTAFKVREVLDAIRGKPVHEAADLLRFVERDCALLIEKLLHSAVANASNNDGLDPDELYISACYADEGPTAKRWRPRARGRATRIRKRSCHITVIVSRMPEAQLARLQARRQAENLAMRARRVEATRRARTESAEGASRRERRHPEAVEGEAGTEAEAGAETADAPETDVVAEAAPEKDVVEAAPEAGVVAESAPEADVVAESAPEADVVEAAPEADVVAEAAPVQVEPETDAEPSPGPATSSDATPDVADASADVAGAGADVAGADVGDASADVADASDEEKDS
jgi:large subunit ribosomal protein L22